MRPAKLKTAEKINSMGQPWTDEETARLKELHAAGATALRASVVLKRSRKNLMDRARRLGIPFPTPRELKKRQLERERAILDETPS